MSIDDIYKENDILLWLGPRLEKFEELINKVFGTKNITFWGTEYNIPYGGGRVDIMFGNREMLVPVELKYNGNKDSYEQIKKYVKQLEERENKEINGVLMCIHATKGLKEINIDNNIMILELETGKAW